MTLYILFHLVLLEFNRVGRIGIVIALHQLCSGTLDIGRQVKVSHALKTQSNLA